MIGFDMLDTLFVGWALLLQLGLSIYFAFRKWAYETALRQGWIVYASGMPALFISMWLWRADKPWYLWVAGLVFGAWTLFGYIVDRVRHISWRRPLYWPVLVPYVFLYLAGQCLYWWGVGLLSRPLWFVYAALFVISTVLNLTSHGEPRGELQPSKG
jgi:hypothetical protein